MEPGGEGALAEQAESGREILKNNVHTATEFGVVSVPLFFTEEILRFAPKAMRFLREYGPGTNIEDAAKKANVPVEYCIGLLKRKSVKAFLADKFQQIAIQQGWTVERWFCEGDLVWRGKKSPSREQMDIWKEFGARILPKARHVTGGGDEGDKPQIIINVGAVDEAFQRQKAIEADILDARAKGAI